MKWKGIAENLAFAVLMTVLVWILSLSAIMVLHQLTR